MFKYVRSELPENFNDMYVKNVNVHNHKTRQGSYFHFPSVRTNVRKMVIAFQGILVWNNIAKYIDTECSILTFKKRLKKHLLDKQNQQNVF